MIVICDHINTEVFQDTPIKISSCKRIYKPNSNAVDFYDQGKMILSSESSDEAITLFTKSILQDPLFSDPYYEIAKMHYLNNDLLKALKFSDQALFLYPSFSQAFLLKGDILFAMNNFSLSILAYYSALLIDSSSFDGWVCMGKCFENIKNYEKALVCFEKALNLDVGNLEVYVSRGNCLYYLGHKERAIDAYTQALDYDHSHAVALFSLAYIYQELSNVDAAIFYYKQLLIIDPNNINALVNLGNCFQEIKKHTKAIDLYNKALSIEYRNPEIHYNKGQALYNLGMIDEAISSNSICLLQDSTYAKAYCNMGLCYSYIGQYEKALKFFDMSLLNNPAHLMAKFNRSLIELVNGDYLEGWKNYETRFFVDKPKVNIRSYPFPRLDNTNIKNKRVLLYAEQGLGDTIQYSRFAKQLVELGANITLEVNSSLKEILSTLDPKIEIVCSEDPSRVFDFHQTVMSLPYILQITTDTIPYAEGYLSLPSERKKYWQSKLSKTKKPRIGIVWSGAALYENDQNRSIPYTALEPLWDLPVEFFSLQKEIRDYELKCVLSNKKLNTFCSELVDFSETASLASQMDLIITVDTSVAHLCGSLGLKTWVLLPKVPDYRWMLQTQSSVWYKSVRLFRQNNQNDWSSVINNIINEVQRLWTL
ncbi:MAG: tetratricopeptide repeat protein [Chlamydiae bacterium]|nr:tetratricopeptide repeat protein [Chlamydiota bacterium]